MICQNCNAENVDDAVFCCKCGMKIGLEQSKCVCTRCGSELNEDDCFCVECGTGVESSVGVNEDIGDEVPSEENGIESFDAQISTDIPFVTWLLTALIVACSGYVFLRTNSLMHVSADALLKFGGNLKSLTFSGEEWRLWSSTFLHGGLIHLAMNMACLLSFGPLLERMTGHIKFLSFYLISAIGSGIISMKFNSDVVSIGASGAIFGIFGSLMMYVLVMGKRFGLTYDSIWAYMKEGLVFIGVNLIYSLRPGIDMSAHLGGLLVGAGQDYLLLL